MYQRSKNWIVTLLTMVMLFMVIVPAGFVFAEETVKKHDRGAAYTDLVGTETGIQFQIFNYSEQINFNSDGTPRPISAYFNFRGTGGNTEGIETTSGYDEDGFTANHATVERVLAEYPTLCLTRDADGNVKTPPEGAPTGEDLSLGYLFGAGDSQVTKYTPVNTLLRYDENTGYYEYNSAVNAADYDTASNQFIVYENPERGQSTANYENSENYADFFPFNDGTGTSGISDNEVDYIYKTEEVDYWFGMTMQTEFLQPRDGKIREEDMIFQFSGDDDVWVFIDDILVLDLGGTHGVVTGNINFATGKVEAYIDWNGVNGKEDNTKYYTTTIREAFEKAGKNWENSNETFSDYGTHTLKYYYLERGSGCSNCHIKFNLQTLPENSLSISKDVEALNEGHLESLQDNEYAVQLYVQENEAKEYTVWKEFQDGKGNILETEADGTIRLQNGETVIAAGIPVTANYYLKEVAGDAYEVKFLCDGKDITGIREKNTATSKETAVGDGNSKSVVIRNTHKLQSLRISKQVAGNMADTDKEFEFELQVRTKAGGELCDFDLPYNSSKENLSADEEQTYKFTLGHNDVIEFTIPHGYEYTIRETDYSKEGYRTSFSKNGGEAESAQTCIGVLAGSQSVNYLNEKASVVPTGNTENGMPYVWMMVLGIVGMLVIRYAEKQRKMR